MAASNFKRNPTARVHKGETRSERERARAMLTHISSGMSLRRAAKKEGLSHVAFLAECVSDQEFAKEYARAREIGIDLAVDDMRDEADTLIRYAKRNGAHASAAVSALAQKQRIEMWRIERQHAKKYGRRVELAGDPDAPLQGVVLIPAKESATDG